mmetsp:Transcript_7906/g.19654  ORF Transcript_7906/g.19654 Transcript_7906/m.19654 type:complete len:256 (+) Transcript_7906:480-1247(+)
MQNLYVHVCIATLQDIQKHDGMDLVNWNEITPLKLRRSMTLGELKELLIRDRMVNTNDHNLVALWKCVNRQNNTVRPVGLLANGDVNRSLGDVVRESFGFREKMLGRDDVIKIFVEQLDNPAEIDNTILLFFKHYQPLKAPHLQTVATLHVPNTEKIGHLLDWMRNYLKAHDGEEIAMFEEVSAKCITTLDPSHRFVDVDMELGGDIVTFQKVLGPAQIAERFSALTPEEIATLPFGGKPIENAKDYYSYICRGY